VIELAVTLSATDDIEPADLVVDRGDPLSVVASDNLTLRNIR